MAISTQECRQNRGGIFKLAQRLKIPSGPLAFYSSLQPYPDSTAVERQNPGFRGPAWPGQCFRWAMLFASLAVANARAQSADPANAADTNAVVSYKKMSLEQ